MISLHFIGKQMSPVPTELLARDLEKSGGTKGFLETINDVGQYSFWSIDDRVMVVPIQCPKCQGTFVNTLQDTVTEISEGRGLEIVCIRCDLRAE